jgi:hypothetical protein
MSKNIPISNSSIINSESDLNNKIEIQSINVKNNENENNEKTMENETIFGNPFSLKNPIKLGKIYSFFYINGNPVIAVGVNKLSFVISYEFILNLSFILFKIFIVKDLNKFLINYIYINYFTIFFCHSYLFLFNLGIVDRNCYATNFRKTEKYKSLTLENKREYLYCEYCNIIVKKKYNVNHCEDCDICIYEYDHHCVWVGKCISKKNIFFFYCFMFGTLIYIISYFIVILIWLYEITKY